MNKFSGTRDVAAIVRSATPTPPMDLLWLCGHKGPRTGGLLRGKLPMRCPNCNKPATAARDSRSKKPGCSRAS